jgi:hypothetical protein
VKIGRGSLEAGVDRPSVICNMLTITRRRQDHGWDIEVISIGQLLLQRLIKMESELAFQVF